MGRVVALIAEFEGHLAGQILLDGEIPFLDHRVAEVVGHFAECSEDTG